MQTVEKPKQSSVKVRPPTHRKLIRIKKIRGWTASEFVDRAANAELDRIAQERRAVGVKETTIGEQ